VERKMELYPELLFINVYHTYFLSKDGP